MLLFTRRTGETVVITVGGERVTIMLTRIRNDHRAIIGIDAPKNVLVNRGEIQLRADLQAAAVAEIEKREAS